MKNAKINARTKEIAPALAGDRGRPCRVQSNQLTLIKERGVLPTNSGRRDEMREADRAAVRALHLFAGMTDDGFEALVRGSFLQAFPAGVELFRQGDRADFLHVLLEGTVELGAASAGRETTVALVRPVASFILAAVLRDKPYLMMARTLGRSRVLMIPGEAVRAAFTTDPAFALAVVDELARAFRFMVREIKNHKLRSGVERLANWLLLAADAEGRLLLDIEKRVLAARLGMTPENLSRAFATLGGYGVSVNGRAVTLRDRDSLCRLAHPDPLIDQL
jgi:CRP/FNR family transcriptional activator FtrB